MLLILFKLKILNALEDVAARLLQSTISKHGSTPGGIIDPLPEAERGLLSSMFFNTMNIHEQYLFPFTSAISIYQRYDLHYSSTNTANPQALAFCVPATFNHRFVPAPKLSMARQTSDGVDGAQRRRCRNKRSSLE